MYDTGLKVANDPGLTKLDFVAYLKTLYASYVFAVFSMPHNFPYIEKTQFLKAIREDRLPNSFEENEINSLYNIISSNPLHKVAEMNFESFAFFLNLNRLFFKHSTKRPLHLNKKEIQALLKDPLAPGAIVNAIDKSENKFTVKDYKEASLYLQRKTAQESDFYYSFKSNKQPEWFAHRSDVVSDFLPFPRSHMPLVGLKENKLARETFFNIMVEVDKDHWNKNTFYKAFQFSNLFVALTTDFRYFVSVSSVLNFLPQYYDIVSPSISQNQRRNLAFYKTLPKECFLDLLTFLEVENYENKFMNAKISNINTVTETLLKIVMKDYGMSVVPDEIIDIAQTGYDKLKRRVYNADKVMHVLMVVQVLAAEIRRTKEMKKSHKIKENKAPGRNYPQGERRLKDSVLV